MALGTRFPLHNGVRMLHETALNSRSSSHINADLLAQYFDRIHVFFHPLRPLCSSRGMSQVSDPVDLIPVVSRLRNVAYVDCIALAYNIADYAQTFEWEITYMWRAKWTVVKVVYLVGRYLGLVDYPLMFVYRHSSGLNPSQCNILFDIAACSALTGATFGEILMFLRVYVLAGCTKIMGWYLTIHFSTILLVMFVFAILFLKSLIYAPSPVPELIGCYLQSSDRGKLSLVYTLVLVHQFTVIVLSLYFGLARFRHSRSPLIMILYRDGTLYFMILSAISIGNLTLVIAGPPEYQSLFLMMQRALHSTLSTRIILKLREMAKQDINVQTGPQGTTRMNESLRFDSYPRFTSRQHEFIEEGPVISIMSRGGGRGRGRQVQTVTVGTVEEEDRDREMELEQPERRDRFGEGVEGVGG